MRGSKLHENIVAFTDGACSKNGQPGAVAGYGFVIANGWLEMPDLPLKNGSDLHGPIQTNNRAEYTAAIEAIKAVNRADATSTVCSIVDA